MGYSVLVFVRPLVLLSVVGCAAFTPVARASNAFSSEELLLDAGALTQLEARAQTAQPREQCFLYTELVHHLTELAGKQMASGQMDDAATTFHRIDEIAQRIHMALARDTKRLKNAEMLLHHTSRRLNDMLHVAPGDDRPLLQATLKRLETVQSELLTQVFAH